jgi:hypothetical protein
VGWGDGSEEDGSDGSRWEDGPKGDTWASTGRESAIKLIVVVAIASEKRADLFMSGCSMYSGFSDRLPAIDKAATKVFLTTVYRNPNLNCEQHHNSYQRSAVSKSQSPIVDC